MAAVNYLTLRSTILFNAVGGAQVPTGYLNVASTGGVNTLWTNNIGVNNVVFSTLVGSTMTSVSSIGIGTATPAYVLDAVGGIRATTGLNVGNGTGAVGLNLYDLAAASWQITTGGYNLSINNNSASWTNRVTINQSGQVAG